MPGFFDAFTGRSQSRAINNAYTDSQAQLRQGEAQGRSDITSGRNDAVGTLDPWMRSGQRGQTAYEDTLGLNGQGARERAFKTGYLDDPALAYRNQNNQLQMNQLYRKYNAGGQGINSGAATLGAGRLASEQFNTDWGGYQNRLQGLGQQGQQVAGQIAGIQYGAGKDFAGLTERFTNTRAGNTISHANADAAARGIGVNNLLRVGEIAASAFGGGRGGGGGGQSNYYNPGYAWTNPDNGLMRT